MPAKTGVSGARPAARPLRQASEQEDDGLTSAQRRAVAEKRKLIRIFIGAGVALVLVIVLIAAYGPIKRSRQLAALDACTTPAQVEQARELARAFAQDWGAQSVYVVRAVEGGRGPVEARIELCRAGKHLRQLANLLKDDRLSPAQRGLVCAALSELWPSDNTGPAITPKLFEWALAPEAEPALAEPALRLVLATAPAEAEANLSRAAADGKLSSERAVGAAMALGRIIARRGNSGVSLLLAALGGPHRAAILAAPPLPELVAEQALNGDIDALHNLLDKPDSALLGLVGLGGKRLHVEPANAKARELFAARLTPFLAPDTEDAKLAAALQVVRQQRLVESRAQVLALLPRLGKRRPAQLPPDDLADLLGRALVHTQNPAAAEAAEAMVAGLTAALEADDSRILATVALSRVREPELDKLRLALDALGGYASATPACADALDILVGGPYARPDVVSAAKTRGWRPVLADDRRRRARYDEIRAWLGKHADENTVATDQKIIAANKVALQGMRDELTAWQGSSDPLPLGVTKAKLTELANSVQMMLYTTIKASSGVKSEPARPGL